MSARRGAIEATGTLVAFVYQGSEKQAEELFTHYGLPDVARFRDPEAHLYRAFGLGRGKMGQILGWEVLRRGFQALRGGHGQGRLTGDGFQMPGVFLLHQGQILQDFRHATIADRPDYVALATEN